MPHLKCLGLAMPWTFKEFRIGNTPLWCPCISVALAFSIVVLGSVLTIPCIIGVSALDIDMKG